jgi:hypothetical protein
METKELLSRLDWVEPRLGIINIFTHSRGCHRNHDHWTQMQSSKNLAAEVAVEVSRVATHVMPYHIPIPIYRTLLAMSSSTFAFYR